MSTSAIINVPILEEYNEVEMLTSVRSHEAGHRIISLKISNHKANSSKRTKTRLHIPSGISIDPQTKYYSVRTLAWVDIAMTHKLIEPQTGLEQLNAFLKQSHPKEEFYVKKMLTETVVDGMRRSCTWARRSSTVKQGAILSLQLMFIDGRKVNGNFSDEQMKHVVGRLTDSVCRLVVKPSERLVSLCNPAPVA